MSDQELTGVRRPAYESVRDVAYWMTRDETTALDIIQAMTFQNLEEARGLVIKMKAEMDHALQNSPAPAEFKVFE